MSPLAILAVVLVVSASSLALDLQHVEGADKLQSVELNPDANIGDPSAAAPVEVKQPEAADGAQKDLETAELFYGFGRRGYGGYGGYRGYGGYHGYGGYGGYRGYGGYGGYGYGRRFYGGYPVYYGGYGGYGGYPDYGYGRGYGGYGGYYGGIGVGIGVGGFGGGFYR